MSILNYLNRINYTGEVLPSFAVLKELQRAHLLHVPFENLDIHYGIPIILDINKIYDKIVINKRGGFCYELNSLFCSLLKNIGFDAKLISAKVYNQDKESYGKEYDHMAVLVNINQNNYLVDVGFGEFCFYPLKITPNDIQSDPRGKYRIEKYNEDYYKVIKIERKSSCTPQYIFTLLERRIEEFEGMCQFHQTSPDSHFTHKKLITGPVENGRITLSDNSLKITEKGKVINAYSFSDKDYKKELFLWFKVIVN